LVHKQRDINVPVFFFVPREFTTQKQKCSVVRDSSSVSLENYGSNKTNRLKRIAEWLPTDDAQETLETQEVRVSYLNYDREQNVQR